MAKAEQKIYHTKYLLTIHTYKRIRQIDELIPISAPEDKQELRIFNRSEIQKIYVVSDPKGSILYIGTTHSPIRTTLNQGLKSSGRNRYYGYKWKDKNRVIINVWCVKRLTEEMITKVRSEMTFLIRKKTGKWPLFQNEMRFTNGFPDGAVLAERLIRDLE
jgi:hypothetical protein